MIHKLPRRRDPDRDQRGGSLHRAVQAGAAARHRARHALRAVSGLGIRRARACTSTRRSWPCRCSISSILLFYLGAAFAYYVVFPVMLSFFVATTPHGVQMMTDMGSYLDFVMVLLLAFGLAFEVPVATVLLVWTGFVKLATLKKNRGFVLLGIFIFAAFVTPPDAVSQSAMAVPMYLLYEIGIIMAGLLLKDKIAARAKEEAEQAEREAGA